MSLRHREETSDASKLALLVYVSARSAVPAALRGKGNDAASNSTGAPMVVGVLAVRGALRQPQQAPHQLPKDVCTVILD